MIKVTFRAFDRILTEVFPSDTTEEEIKQALHEKCYTFVIICISEIN